MSTSTGEKSTLGGVAPRRRKRTPDVAREEALAAARALLIEGGPDAVTLKAVGARIGMTHPNLIHHFGSAGQLQVALMGAMVRDLTDALGDAVAYLRTDDAAPRLLVDKVFDAFDEGGAGVLAAWIALRGDMSHLEPIREAVGELVTAVEEKFPQDDPSLAHRRITSAVLFLALCAFGDAVIGEPLRTMMAREPDATRKMAAHLLPMFLG